MAKGEPTEERPNGAIDSRKPCRVSLPLCNVFDSVTPLDSNALSFAKFNALRGALPFGRAASTNRVFDAVCALNRGGLVAVKLDGRAPVLAGGEWACPRLCGQRRTPYRWSKPRRGTLQRFAVRRSRIRLRSLLLSLLNGIRRDAADYLTGIASCCPANGTA